MKRSMGIFGKKTQFYKKPILVLMGAPGVGKGTYGKRLSKEWNMPIKYADNPILCWDSRHRSILDIDGRVVEGSDNKMHDVFR